MVLEIKSLMDSDIPIIKELGWFLFSKNFNNGLSKEETHELIELIHKTVKLIEYNS